MPAVIQPISRRWTRLRTHRGALSVPGFGAVAAGQLFGQIGTSAYTIVLFVLVYRVTGTLAGVAALALVHLLPRLILLAAGRHWAVRSSHWLFVGAGFLRLPLVAGLLLLPDTGSFGWLISLTFALGACYTVIGAARSVLIPALVATSRIGVTNAVSGRIEQVGITFGALGAAFALAAAGERAALAWAGLCLAGSFFFSAWAGSYLRSVSPSAHNLVSTATVWSLVRRRTALLVFLLTLFTGGIVGITFRITLVEMVLPIGDAGAAIYALLLALVGCGALAGPLSIPRALGRLGPRFAAAGILVALALNLALVGLVHSIIILALALFVSGILAVTNDLLAAAATRRLVPADQVETFFRLLVAGTVGGQVVGSLLILGLGWEWGPGALLLLVAAWCLLAALASGLSQTRLRG